MKRVAVEEFARRMEQGGCVVLDVRTADEFASGHIPGAINLDIHSATFAESLGSLDPGQTTLVYCRSGRRSASACEIMVAQGFVELLDLAPGFNGWQAAGQSVSR